ncbi:hypothetical protein PZ895_11310 [Mesorhizobium sp. YIM 152430]|uniref:hypothetical protein n=1 Tax=Mesorhizobium sp. YIM 152430 TaxID=3031761 RepID=UPI0023DAFE58|nr:hypothetical protein [Mesorhizobium sp. YIM 152430]MDF1600348.1 hypothetical protein [Mesorhizobium sp. YIM 152430]
MAIWNDPTIQVVGAAILGGFGSWAGKKYLDHVWGEFYETIRIKSDEELDRDAAKLIEDHPSIEAHRLALTNGLLPMFAVSAFVFSAYQAMGYLGRLIGVPLAGDLMSLFSFLFVAFAMILAIRFTDRHAASHRALRRHLEKPAPATKRSRSAAK